jgi:hypothetical protein
MELLQDGVVAFLSAVGLTSVVWLMAGAFFPSQCRNPDVRILLPLRGEAANMEGDLRDLQRLRRALPKARILLLDRGMDEDAKRTAAYFCRRWDNVDLAAEEEFRPGDTKI